MLVSGTCDALDHGGAGRVTLRAQQAGDQSLAGLNPLDSQAAFPAMHPPGCETYRPTPKWLSYGLRVLLSPGAKLPW